VRWQNTIFGFLKPQLNFLAIFSTDPENEPKKQILINSSRLSRFPKFDNYPVFIVLFSYFYFIKNALLRWFQKRQNQASWEIFRLFEHFRPQITRNPTF